MNNTFFFQHLLGMLETLQTLQVTLADVIELVGTLNTSISLLTTCISTTILQFQQSSNSLRESMQELQASRTMELPEEQNLQYFVGDADPCVPQQ